MRKKESRENKESPSDYRHDYPPQQRSYPRKEQYPRNRNERTEKSPQNAKKARTIDPNTKNFHHNNSTNAPYFPYI